MGRGARNLTILSLVLLISSSLSYLYLQHRERPLEAPLDLDSLVPGGSPGVEHHDIPVESPRPPPSRPPSPPPSQQAPPSPPRSKPKHHAIDDMIKAANEKFDYTLDKQSENLRDAAIAYRVHRGRHPPPHFDKWVTFAQDKNALIIEEHFDQIYHDLGPLWGLSPEGMRNQARSWPHVISVRDHNATQRSNQPRSWMELWLEMFAEIQHLLPDVDLAMNEMDETRLWVPWEKINDYMASGEAHRKNDLKDTSSMIADFQTLGSAEALEDDHQMIGDGAAWEHARACCAPLSPGRNASVIDDFSLPPTFPDDWPDGSYQGFVANWSYAKHPCLRPEVRHLHGAFVEPISTSLSTELFPMFGGSKMPFNNEILLPAPAYWTEDPRFTAEVTRREWDEKKNALIWRGTASGGRNRDTNWAHFQRHRFVAMTNGSYVRYAEASERSSQTPLAADEPSPGNVPSIFKLPNGRDYDVAAAKNRSLGDWIGSFSDSMFMDLFCYPVEPEGACKYTGPYYEQSGSMSMSEQYAYKYLPDIDGNSFSGRYRAFLFSDSLPIKATIYSEWLDSRLIPWKHFVPMDTTYMDFWGIMDYFMGFNDSNVRDDKAKKIAYDGADWAGRVLRKEDMLVYLYRLVLEYARITDDRRDRMGFVNDLRG
ncbi:MAG: hypothetical protein M1828_005933 [Chrysothrix sp. TS-e1954]|nr:MAG: hypothetical protein M1828_005933 [Chrysothrix sp. TS-e1954]